MATFVEATDANGGGRKIFINMDLVTRISRLPNDQGALILFAAGVHASGDSWLWQEAKVTETPEELLKLPRRTVGQ